MHKYSNHSITLLSFEFLCLALNVLKSTPLPRHLQTISVGAKQSQRCLDPGAYERSSLISLGQELHQGSESETQTQLQMRRLCVCLCVCDVFVFFDLLNFSREEKNKQQRSLESLFIFFYVLWFPPVSICNSWKHILFCLSPTLCNQGGQQSD